MLKRIDARIPEELLNDIREAAKDEGVTVTDIMSECFRLYLTAKKEEEEINNREAEKAKKPAYQPMPAPEIVAPASPGEAEKSVSEPDIGKDTIYEPDPVRPAKQPKAKSNAAPIVNALLSGVNASPTTAHHPLCSCAICKP
jgi:hypothetical protein